MTGNRKRYSADFEAKVALKGELTLSQLATKCGVHQTMIAAWRKQAIEGLSGVFSGKAEAAEGAREGETDKLHAKIGQLVVERDLFSQSLRSLSLDRRPPTNAEAEVERRR